MRHFETSLTSEIVNQLVEINHVLYQICREIDNDENATSAEKSLRDHLKGIDTALWYKREKIGTGTTDAILENREQDPTTHTSLQSIIEQAIQIASVVAGPGKLKLAVQAVTVAVKKLYNPFVDLTRGFYVSRDSDEYTPYHGLKDFVKLQILHPNSGYETIQTLPPYVIPNRTSGPYVLDLICDKLNLQLVGPPNQLKDVDRSGNEIRQTVYSVGIAPMFEILEEVVTEYPDREIRHTFILRRKS